MKPSPLCVSPSTKINEAVHLMGKAKIGCVLVANEDELLGIFTERDLLQMFAADASVSLEGEIGGDMTATPLYTIDPESEAVDALCLMVENNIRHLPVVHDGKIVGILGFRDLVKPDEVVP